MKTLEMSVDNTQFYRLNIKLTSTLLLQMDNCVRHVFAFSSLLTSRMVFYIVEFDFL